MEILDAYQAQAPQRELKYASFGLRVAALVIDLMIISVSFFLLMIILAAIAVLALRGPVTQQHDRNFLSVAYFVLLPCFFIFYFAFMESSSRGGSWGKIGVGIRVGGHGGEKISFSTALKRSLGKILSAATVGIGFIMLILNSKKQSLHDKIANTFVFKR